MDKNENEDALDAQTSSLRFITRYASKKDPILSSSSCFETPFYLLFACHLSVCQKLCVFWLKCSMYKKEKSRKIDC